ncbi:MAG: hypothetical protein GY729_12655 [Desulfobacteraceae bacterium]|nr:hypothetical protein [Desulfobacteraceae bacterium]
MNDLPSQRPANIQKRETKLRAIRNDIIKCDGDKALEQILDHPSPATLIQSFPDQDLYYLMHKIGKDDFIPVLALAASEQWEHIIDVDVWDNDRLDPIAMAQTFDVLFQADPERLLRWVITKKPDFFEFFLSKNLEVKIREHDELTPSDYDDYITIDDKFYFRFPKYLKAKENQGDEPDQPNGIQTVPELIEKMLKAVANMDLYVYHGLLQETEALLPAESEEEQFRLKNIRLAEKGFLPTHEAIGIYQPTDLENLKKRPESLKKTEIDPDIPLPPQCFSQYIKGENLFVKSLALLDDQGGLSLETELAALINKIISADKIKVTSQDILAQTVNKACAFLSLGLEIISNGKTDPAKAARIIELYYLEDIFRTGSRAGIKLKTKAQGWYKKSFLQKNNLPLSFLGEDWLGIIGGLFLERPLYYDNYQTGTLYRNFKCFKEISHTDTELNKIIELDGFLSYLPFDIHTFQEGFLNYKTLILTLWSRSRLGLDLELTPIDVSVFKEFFKDLFQRQASAKNDEIRRKDILIWAADIAKIEEKDLSGHFVEVVNSLLKEVDEEYKDVDPKDIDPKFMPHFFLKKN